MATYNPPQYQPYSSSTAHTGKGPYGLVPGATALPNAFSQLSSLYPNLGNQNQQLSGNIMSELKGELSPETINAIHNAAASFGVSSGMPGSQLSGFGGLRNLGLATENVQRQGLQDYLGATSGIKSTQTVSPETQIALDEYNKQLEAAPDPAAATGEMLKLSDPNYLSPEAIAKKRREANSLAEMNRALGASNVASWSPQDINTF